MNKNLISYTVRARIAGALVFLAGSAQNLFAQEAAPQQSPLGGLVPFIVILFIFYFLLIRPQQKRAKEHQKMLAAVKKDDRIVTTGGIYGTIVNVKGAIVEIKIAENVKIQLAKSAIATVIQSDDQVVTPEVLSK